MSHYVQDAWAEGFWPAAMVVAVFAIALLMGWAFDENCLAKHCPGSMRAAYVARGGCHCVEGP
jgi:hypothetical protein